MYFLRSQEPTIRINEQMKDLPSIPVLSLRLVLQFHIWKKLSELMKSILTLFIKLLYQGGKMFICNGLLIAEMI